MFYEDNHIKIYNKDCRFMSELPDESVQCVVTSPPYWGLRKYSGEQELIWGDNHCEHQWGELVKMAGHKAGETNPGLNANFKDREGFDTTQRGGFCSLCGAWKGAYGLEPTPEMYIEHTIEILREIRRVLRKDGVVFWNIGDSYASSPPGNKNPMSKSGLHGAQTSPTYRARLEETQQYQQEGRSIPPSMKPKDLCLIPFRVAIAAQEDGWWARSIIIWSKPNPMPESVTDRPTESHEYILMLTKSARYYWDADAVREEYTEPLNRWGGPKLRNTSHKYIESDDNCGLGEFGKTSMLRAGAEIRPNPSGRNIRSVWEFPTQPYPEAHFAVFPEKLPEICIKAATPEVGCCSKCGAPWERITEVSRSNESYWGKQGKTPQDVKGLGKYGDAVASDGDRKRAGSDIRLGPTVSVKTLGWQPTCKCNADKVPSIVLDPFLGAGTTLWVAKKLNRRAVGYEISGEYCRLAVDRCRQQVLL